MVRPVRNFWRFLCDKYGRPVCIQQRYSGPENVWTLGVDEELDDSEVPHESGLRQPVKTWLLSKGAVPVGLRRDEITITSFSPTPILIESIEAEVLEREARPFGSIVKSPSAGAVTVTRLGIDLSSGASGNPVEVVEDGAVAWTRSPYFPRKSLRLKYREGLPIQIISKTTGDSVLWRLHVNYRIGKVERTAVYPGPRESPLVTSDVRAARQYWLCGVEGLHGWPWIRESSHDGVFGAEENGKADGVEDF